jgi:hypothetical protein
MSDKEAKPTSPTKVPPTSAPPLSDDEDDDDEADDLTIEAELA